MRPDGTDSQLAGWKHSTGDSEVSVSMYDGDSIIASYSVNEDNDIVWNA